MVGCMSEHTFISTATGQRSVPRPAATFVARLAAHHWAPLPVVLIAPFMVVLDFFIVNVAIPSMETRLHAGSGAVEWVNRRVRPHLRGRADHQRPPRRPLRTTPDVLSRPAPVHDRLRRLWARLEPLAAGRRSD